MTTTLTTTDAPVQSPHRPNSYAEPNEISAALTAGCLAEFGEILDYRENTNLCHVGPE